MTERRRWLLHEKDGNEELWGPVPTRLDFFIARIHGRIYRWRLRKCRCESCKIYRGEMEAP